MWGFIENCICLIKGHKWHTPLFMQYTPYDMKVCKRCGRVEDANGSKVL
jgi:hypothetical protein